ncbi:MAG: hypothetical protein M1832_004628 [Thelocarpon impressellum]|nr:MAG: hypothetical protein M1832_004628 [Thelocarpon impressellum]
MVQDAAEHVPSPSAAEPRHGGYTRFELELEFVQCLANPWYLNFLATQKLLDEPSFVAYLEYLQYFSKPEYAKFLMYPGPTLKSLELLQQERFRQDILSPDTMSRMIEEGVKASTAGIVPNGHPTEAQLSVDD